MPNIDERVVKMTFDNAQFERGVSKSLKTIDDLKQALELDKAADSLKSVETTLNHFNLSSLNQAAENIVSKFTIVGKVIDNVKDKIAGLANIGIAKAFDFGQMAVGLKEFDSGFDKYAKKTKSVQTIISATGRTIEDVDAVLERLNWYTDMTSYDFSEMVATIGKFTSVGVELEDAEAAMEGIANWAAKSGADKQKANMAFYNLSQAMGMGSLKLQDWKSIELANMGTKEFKETLIDTAIELGVLQKAGDHVGVMLNETSKGVKETVVDYTTLRDTLKDGWVNTEVLMATLAKYADTATPFGFAAFEAARKAYTFQEAIDAVKDALSTGWSQTYEALFGNMEEAGELWTGFCDTIIAFTNVFTEARVDMLEAWHEADGYTAMIEAASNVWGIFTDVVMAAKAAIEEIFPPMTGDILADITKNLRDITAEWREALWFMWDTGDEAEEIVESTQQAAKASEAVASEAVTAQQAMSTMITESANAVETSAKAADQIREGLRRGMRGDDVKVLQEKLRAAGYKLDKYGADGIFGPETQAALKALQKDLGVKQTGVWDDATRAAAKNSKILEELRKGSKGDEVRRLQNNLMEAGYKLDKYGADGIFGPETEAALKKLQKALGVEQTGIWDEATKNAAAAANVFEKSMNRVSKAADISINGIEKTLKKGNRGKLVKKLQQELMAAGYKLDKYGADGIYGPETKKAVKALQRDLGVKQTGVWDDATRAALENAKKMKAAQAQTTKTVNAQSGATADANKSADELVDSESRVTAQTGEMSGAMARFYTIVQSVSAVFGVVVSAIKATIRVGTGIVKMFSPLFAVFTRFAALFAQMFNDFYGLANGVGVFDIIADVILTALEPVGAAIEFVAYWLDYFISKYIEFLETEDKPLTLFSFVEYLADFAIWNTPLKYVAEFALTFIDTISLLASSVWSILEGLFSGIFGETLDEDPAKSPIMKIIDFLAQAGTGALNLISKTVETITPILNGIIGAVTPYIMPAIEGIGNALLGVMNIASELPPVLIPLAAIIGGLVTSLVLFKKKSSNLYSGLGFFDRLLTDINPLTILLGSVIGLLTRPIIMPAITEGLNRLKQTKIFEFISEKIEALKKALNFDATKDVFTNLANAFTSSKNSIMAWVKSVPEKISKVGTAIKDALFPEKDDGTTIFTRLLGLLKRGWDGIATFFRDKGEKLKTFVDGAIAAINKDLPKDDNGQTVLDRVYNGLVAAWEKIKGFFVGVWNGISGAATSIYELFFPKEGDDRTFAERINGMFSGLSASASAFFDSAKNKVIEFWNILFGKDNGVIDFTGQSILDTIGKVIAGIINTVVGAIKGIFGTISTVLSNTNIMDTLEVLISGMFAIAAVNISRGFKKFGKNLEYFKTGLFGTRIERDADSFGTTALKLAGAVALISASIWALSTIPAEQAKAGVDAFVKVVAALAIAVGALKGLDWLFGFINSKNGIEDGDKGGGPFSSVASGVLGIGVGVLALIMAVKKLYDILGEVSEGDSVDVSKQKRLDTAIEMIRNLFIGLAALEFVLGLLHAFGKGGSSVGGILEMAAGVYLIVLAVEKMASVIDSHTNIWAAIMDIAIILGELGLIAILMTAFSSATPGKSESSVGGILKMCAGVYLIVMAVEKLANLMRDNTNTVNAMWGIGILIFELGAIEAGIAAISAFGKNQIGGITISGVLSMAAGVYLIVMAVEKLANLIQGDAKAEDALSMIEDLIFELGAIVVAMAWLSKGEHGAKAAVAGVGSLIAMAVAVTIISEAFADSLKKISGMDPKLVEAFSLGLAAVVGALGAVAAVFALIGTFGGPAAIQGIAIGIGALAALVGIIAGAIQVIGSITAGVIKNFGEAMFFFGTYFESFTNSISRINKDDVDWFTNYVKKDLSEMISSLMTMSVDTAYQNAQTLNHIGYELSNYGANIARITETSKTGSTISKALVDDAKELNDKLQNITVSKNVNDGGLSDLGASLLLYSYMLNNIEAYEGEVVGNLVDDAVDIAGKLNGLTLADDVAYNLIVVASALDLYSYMLSKVGTYGMDSSEVGDKVDADMIHEALSALANAIDPNDISQIQSYAENGDNDMIAASAGINALGTALAKYAGMVKDIKVSDVQGANEIISKFMELKDSFSDSTETVFGMFSVITKHNTGEANFTQIAFDIIKLGGALGLYGTLIGGINSANVKSANETIDEFIKLNDDLKVDSLFGLISRFVTGKDELSQFAESLTSIGNAMSVYITAINGIEDEKLKKGSEFMQLLRQIASYDMVNSTGVIAGDVVNRFDVGILEGIGSGLTAIGTGLQNLNTSVGSESFDVGKVDAVADVIGKLAGFLPVINGVKSETSFSTVGNGLPQLGSDLSGFQTNLGEFDSTKIEGALKIIEQIVNWGPTIAGSHWVDSLGNDVDAYTYLARNINGLFTTLTSDSEIQAVTRAQTERLTAIRDLGSQMVTLLSSGFSTEFDTDIVNTSIATFIGYFIAGIQATYESFIDVGKYLADGLIVGLRDPEKATEVYNAGYAMGDKAKEGVQDATKVASPSKEFEWIGQMCALGLKNGMEGYSDLVSLAGADMANDTLTTIAAAFDESNLNKVAEGALESVRTLFSEENIAAGTHIRPLQEFLVDAGYLNPKYVSDKWSGPAKKAVARFKNEVLGYTGDITEDWSYSDTTSLLTVMTKSLTDDIYTSERYERELKKGISHDLKIERYLKLKSKEDSQIAKQSADAAESSVALEKIPKTLRNKLGVMATEMASTPIDPDKQKLYEKVIDKMRKEYSSVVPPDDFNAALEAARIEAEQKIASGESSVEKANKSIEGAVKTYNKKTSIDMTIMDKWDAATGRYIQVTPRSGEESKKKAFNERARNIMNFITNSSRGLDFEVKDELAKLESDTGSTIDALRKYNEMHPGNELIDEMVKLADAYSEEAEFADANLLKNPQGTKTLNAIFTNADAKKKQNEELAKRVSIKSDDDIQAVWDSWYNSWTRGYTSEHKTSKIDIDKVKERYFELAKGYEGVAGAYTTLEESKDGLLLSVMKHQEDGSPDAAELRFLFKNDGSVDEISDKYNKEIKEGYDAEQASYEDQLRQMREYSKRNLQAWQAYGQEYGSQSTTAFVEGASESTQATATVESTQDTMLSSMKNELFSKYGGAYASVFDENDVSMWFSAGQEYAENAADSFTDGTDAALIGDGNLLEKIMGDFASGMDTEGVMAKYGLNSEEIASVISSQLSSAVQGIEIPTDATPDSLLGMLGIDSSLADNSLVKNGLKNLLGGDGIKEIILDESTPWGKFLSEGLGKGLDAFSWLATNPMTDLTEDVLGILPKAAEIASPSELFYRYGIYILEGLANALMLYGDYLNGPMNDLCQGIVNAAHGAAIGLSEAISSDINVAPIIRPVVDLTGIQSSASQIGEILNSQTLGLGSMEIAARISNLESTTVRNAEEMNINVARLADSVDRLGGRIDNLDAELRGMRIYLDSDAIVAGTVGKMDRALGGRYINVSRIGRR